MSDINFYGLVASLIFLTLSGLGLVILIVALIISMVQKARKGNAIMSQKAFGYVIGSLVPILTGLIFLYAVVSINDPDVLAAFDNYGSFIVMVCAFASMIMIAKQWRRRMSSPRHSGQRYAD